MRTRLSRSGCATAVQGVPGPSVPGPNITPCKADATSCTPQPSAHSSHVQVKSTHLMSVRPNHTSCTSKLSASSVHSTLTAYRSAAQGKMNKSSAGCRRVGAEGTAAACCGASHSSECAPLPTCNTGEDAIGPYPHQFTKRITSYPKPAHPGRHAASTGPRSAGRAACPAGGRLGTQWCSGKRLLNLTDRPAGMVDAEGDYAQLDTTRKCCEARLFMHALCLQPCCTFQGTSR